MSPLRECSFHCRDSGWQRPDPKAANPHLVRNSSLGLEQLIFTRNHIWCAWRHTSPECIFLVWLGVLERFYYFCSVCSHSGCFYPKNITATFNILVMGLMMQSSSHSLQPTEVLSWVYVAELFTGCDTKLPSNATVMIPKEHGPFWQGCISVCLGHTIPNSHLLSSDFSDA